MPDTISVLAQKLPEPLRRALWFVCLWAAGVSALGAVGLLIRFALRVV